MSVFRLFVLQEKTQRTLSTLRYRTFAIGAYFEKIGDTLKLKIALIKKRRKWFVGLWDKPKFRSRDFLRFNGLFKSFFDQYPL